MISAQTYSFAEDVAFYPLSYASKDGFIIWGSKTKDKFIRLPESWKPIIAIMDCEQGKDNALDHVRKELANILTNADDFIALLYYKHLITLDGKEFDDAKKDGLARNKDEFSANVKKLFSIPIKHNVSNHAAGIIKKFFDIFVVILLPICCFMLYMQRSHIFHKVVFSDIVIAVVISSLSMFLHEFAHVITANKYGIKATELLCRSYMVFQLYVSVHLPGVHTVTREQRAEISFAGPEMNLFLAELAVIVYSVLFPVQDVHVFLYIALVNFILSMTNMNPFFDTDGYHLISNFIFKEYDIKSQSLNLFLMHKKMSAKNKLFLISFTLSRLCILCGSLFFFLYIYRNYLSVYIEKIWAIIVFSLCMVAVLVLQLYTLSRFFTSKNNDKAGGII